MIIIMKSKIIKRIAGIGSIGLAGVLAVGTILHTVLPVRAEETLFGIETLIQEVQSRERPYRILELVPDERAAEIGYFIPGYEPVLSARQTGTGEWTNWEQGLKQYKTTEERKQYMESLNVKLQEFYALRGFTNSNQPVTYRGYAESDKAQNGYKELVFEEETRKGYFRRYTGMSGTDRYELTFRYAGNYDDSDIVGNITTQYYYVENATLITEDLYDSMEDNTALYEFVAQTGADRFVRVGTWGELKTLFEKSVSDNDASVSDNGTGSVSVSGNGSVSGGNSSVSGGNSGDTSGDNAGEPEEPIEYYQLEIAPWEQDIVPVYSALYITETIALSEDGEFEFVEIEDGFDNSFHTDSIYYKGGFENNEWFHTKVLNRQSGDVESFPMEVITLTVAELNALQAAGQLPVYDMLYLNSGMQSFAGSEVMAVYAVDNDITDAARLALFSDVVAEAKPCIVDASILYTTDAQGVIGMNTSMTDTEMLHLAAMFLQKSPQAYYKEYVLNQTTEPTVVELLGGMESDTDKNFVVEQTYSFYAPNSLIDPAFAEASIYRDGQGVAGEEEGFEVVLDEIQSENLNREADSSGEYALLSTDVSRASAVRHIMNYSNRRRIEVKKTIRVLEIQPAKSDKDSYDLTEAEVLGWAPEVEQVRIDRMTTAEFIGKIEDINENYDLIYIGTDRDSMNLVSGTERISNVPTSLQNGNFENGANNWNIWGDAMHSTENAYNGGGAMQVNGSTVTQVVEVKAETKYTLSAWGKTSKDELRGTLGVDFMKGPNDSDRIASGAYELEFTTTDYTKKSVTFTTLAGTTHIKLYMWSGGEALYFDDIALEEVISENDATSAGSTVFNDSSMDGLIYFHTGDMRYAAMELAGLLDTEYVDGKRENNVYYYNPVRYGGNDITEKKMEELLSFLDASYPIIVSDEMFESAVAVYQNADWTGYHVDLQPRSYTTTELNAFGIKEGDISSLKVSEGYKVTVYTEDNFGGSFKTFTADSNYVGDDWNDKISSMVVEEIEGQESLRARKIDADHIDNSSFMYEFIKAAMGKTNFYARSDMADSSGMFQFYLNRPKINLTNVVANGMALGDEVIDIYPQQNDRYMLEYKFTIQNEGAASADTQYECELFIDVNADGKYSDSEELGDITLTQNGKAVSSTNLYAGREYELRRYVPDGYKGVLPWKIQISQVNNDDIHNGVTGYTKLRGMVSETLRILQICRDEVTEVNWWGGANEVFFNLEEKIDDPTDIYHILIYGGTYNQVEYEGISDDFKIDVDFMKISEFEAAYAEDNELLKQYNMLILGFSDAYGNITGNAESGPISAIMEFIESGKSVLFAHDTVSYFNYEEKRENESGELVDRVGVTSHSDTTKVKQTDQYHNSYNLAKYIRGLVGMDRYGVTSLDFLREGKDLNTGSGNWNNLVGQNKEIAYVPKSNRIQSTGLTQGYTYSIINAKDSNVAAGRHETYTSDQTGAGEFRNTYLNLDYGNVYYHDYSSDDGEVKDDYNCEVSNLWVTRVNSGQITDYPYKLADEFMVSNTHAQYYQLDFAADDDNDGQSDLVVWYCLGQRSNSKGERQETIYSMSPNDVSNNYYIYNKGNITYTGVGHAGNNSTVEEAKLFINTMIASYSAGIKNPTISIMSGATGDTEEISSFYSYEDESNHLYFDSSEITQSGQEGRKKLYFSVYDPNFVKGERALSIRCYYEAASGDVEGVQKITYEGEELSLKALPMEIYDAKTNRIVKDWDNLTSGASYYILFDEDTMGDYESRFSVYFEAQSRITTTGTINNSKYTIETDKVYSRFDYTRIQLFDLE